MLTIIYIKITVIPSILTILENILYKLSAESILLSCCKYIEL